MPTLPFDFHNASGDRLSGRIELPQRPPHAWAVLTHCFTCGRDNLAAVRIARRLATGGIGVLRFDFTGLGSSEGEFADTDFGGNVQDLIAAVAAMTTAGMAPTLLIGHSLGGAAALAAACTPTHPNDSGQQPPPANSPEAEYGPTPAPSFLPRQTLRRR